MAGSMVPKDEVISDSGAYFMTYSVSQVISAQISGTVCLMTV